MKFFLRFNDVLHRRLFGSGKKNFLSTIRSIDNRVLTVAPITSVPCFVGELSVSLTLTQENVICLRRSVPHNLQPEGSLPFTVIPIKSTMKKDMVKCSVFYGQTENYTNALMTLVKLNVCVFKFKLYRYFFFIWVIYFFLIVYCWLKSNRMILMESIFFFKLYFNKIFMSIMWK